MNNYETNLEKNNANFIPLTPLSFLERAKDIYPNYEALVYETRSYTWTEVYKRCTKFASALEKIGIRKGDTVSVMAFNTPEIFEAHYSVPMTGAVLNTINVRLDAKTVSYILNHSEAKVFIVDRQLHSIIQKALTTVDKKPIIIDIQDDFADQKLLKKIAEKGVSILLVEQKLTIAFNLSKRLFIMGHGKVVYEGTPVDINNNQSIIKEWLEVS